MMIHSLTTASEPSDGRSQTTQHSHRSIGLEGSNVHTNTRSPRKSLQPRRQRVNWNALGKQLHPVYLVKSFFRSIKHVPIFVWYLFVEAFVIPEYRPEWGPFRKWRPFFETSEAKAKYLEYIKLKCRRRRKKVQIAEALPKPVVHDHSLCKIIKLNVSGKIYQTTLRTLCHFPNTLLGNPRRLGQFFDPIEEDYFFDRSRACFDAILQYYQTRGTLRRPSDISLEIFEEEIQFYDLGQHVIEQLRIDEGIYDELEKPVPRNLLKRKFWLLFEYPHSSSQARIVAMLSVFVVLVSITVFCLDTMPSIQLPRDNLPISLDGPFFLAETACVSWFIFEFLMRALNAPGTIAFFKSPTNIIDFLAILPYFMYIFLALRHNFFVASRAWLEPISQVMKLAKVLRILKLCRYNKGLQVLGKTLRASVRELMLLMFLLIIGLVLFSSTVFFAERIMDPAQANFTSIPDAFWWSIVTMTTCGYGDYEPRSNLGRMVGAVCAIAGVLTLGLPVPILVSNFTRFYAREADNVRLHGEFHHVSQCPSRTGPFYDGDSKRKHHAHGPMTKKSEIGTAVESRNFQQVYSSSDSDFETLKKMPGRGLHVKSSIPVTVTESSKVS